MPERFSQFKNSSGGRSMSNPNVAQFFETVYNDKSLQGALNTALCNIAPEVVVEIAAAKGFKFTTQDLKLAIGSAGETTQISRAALATNFWGSIFGNLMSKAADHELSDEEMTSVVGGVLPVADNPSFRLTIPGPAFVEVQNPEGRDPLVNETVTVSAVDLFEEIR
jgi:predicted ribosomally synthesized peptide with nif11-like leader